MGGTSFDTASRALRLAKSIDTWSKLIIRETIETVVLYPGGASRNRHTPPPKIESVGRLEALIWRRMFLLYLWMSVVICFAIALILGWRGEGEESKIVSGGLLLFAALGVAYARAVRHLDHPRPWHWALGAVLAAPAVFATVYG